MNQQLSPYARAGLTALLLAMSNTAALAAEGFVCTSEHSAGVTYSKTTRLWSGGALRATGKLLIARPSLEQSKAGLSWIVKDIQQNLAVLACTNDFNAKGYLQCKGFGELTFNRVNLRFLRTYTSGYVTDGIEESRWGEEGANTPMVEIGKCTPL